MQALTISSSSSSSSSSYLPTTATTGTGTGTATTATATTTAATATTTTATAATAPTAAATTATTATATATATGTFEESNSDLLMFPKTHETFREATSPYAYVFLLAAVNPDTSTYKGMYWNILVNAHIIHNCNSKADVVVMVQMSANSNSKYEELPPELSQPLYDLHIHVRYFSKPNIDNFAAITLLKANILALTEYRRVLHLDTDVMVFCHLDYLMELSDPDDHDTPTLLKENVIHAGPRTPLNAGMFVLAPQPGDAQAIQDIMQQQQQRDRHLPPPHFNRTFGWGHTIAPDDKHDFDRKTGGTKWDFYGSEIDQGLLYFWVKYYKKSVSICTFLGLSNWGIDHNHNNNHNNKTSATEGDVILEQRWLGPDNFLQKYSTHPNWPSKTKLWRPGARVWRIVPWRDFFHFWGPLKPWLTAVELLPPIIAKETDSKDAVHYWFHVLRLLDAQLSLGIDFDNWNPSMFQTTLTITDKKTLNELWDSKNLEIKKNVTT